MGKKAKAKALKKAVELVRIEARLKALIDAQVVGLARQFFQAFHNLVEGARTPPEPKPAPEPEMVWTQVRPAPKKAAPKRRK
jgi:hypothetical protein